MLTCFGAAWTVVIPGWTKFDLMKGHKLDLWNNPTKLNCMMFHKNKMENTRLSVRKTLKTFKNVESALKSTQKHSEALSRTQKHSAALRNTQQHSAAK